MYRRQLLKAEILFLEKLFLFFVMVDSNWSYVKFSLKFTFDVSLTLDLTF